MPYLKMTGRQPDPLSPQKVEDAKRLEKRPFSEPKLTFVEPKLTKRGDVVEVTGFFGPFYPDE